VQKIEAAGFRGLCDDVGRLANAEDLVAHARAVEVRR
jgi:histidinol dehydrogenase